MAFVNFDELPESQAIQRIQWIEKLPLTPLREQNPVEFYIDNTGTDMIDLQKTRLYVKCRITKSDGSPVTAGSKVGLVNLSLHSLWSEVQVYWQNRLVSGGQLNPYKAYLDTVLNYAEDAKESQLETQLYYKDNANYMDETDPMAGLNFGLTLRYDHTRFGQSVDMTGPLFSDTFQQPHLLLNGIPITVKLTPSPDTFRLMRGDTENYKVDIQAVKLWMCMVSLNPTPYMEISRRLQNTTVKYPIMKSTLMTHTLAQGTPHLQLDNLFQGRVPAQILISFLASEAVRGSYTKNPFNFHHYNLNYLQVTVDGVPYPRRALEPDFANKLYIDSYLTLFTGTGKWMVNDGNNINRDNYPNGYCLYLFNIDPAKQVENLLPISKQGNIKVEARFAQPLPTTVDLLIYAIFPEVIEVDYTRNVYLP